MTPLAEIELKDPFDFVVHRIFTVAARMRSFKRTVFTGSSIGAGVLAGLAGADIFGVVAVVTFVVVLALLGKGPICGGVLVAFPSADNIESASQLVDALGSWETETCDGEPDNPATIANARPAIAKRSVRMNANIGAVYPPSLKASSFGRVRVTRD